MSFIDRFLNAIKLNDDFDEDDDFLDDDEESEAEEEKSVRGRKGRYFSRFDADDEEDDEDFDEDFDEEERPSKRSSRSSRKSKERTRESSSRKSRRSTSSDSSSRANKSGRGTDEQNSEGRNSTSYGNTGSRSRSSGEYSNYGRAGEGGRSVTYGADRDSRRGTDRRSAKKNANGKKRGSSVQPEVNVVRPSSMEDAWQIADTLMDKSMVVLNLEGLDVDVAQRVVDFSCGVCYSLHAEIKKISSYIFLLTPEGVDTSGDYQSILDGTFDIPSMRGSY